MGDTTELTPERVKRRQDIADLTARSAELFQELKSTAARRDELIVAEMEAGAVARDIAELAGLGVSRIYRLRDNGLKRGVGDGGDDVGEPGDGEVSEAAHPGGAAGGDAGAGEHPPGRRRAARGGGSV